MEYATPFLLGLLGSLHCAGMCGPLAVAVSATGGGSHPATGRLLYNLGRLGTYTVLGALFGLFGRGLAIAGFQRWLSVTAGVLILAGLVASTRRSPTGLLLRAVEFLKTAFGRLLGRGPVQAMHFQQHAAGVFHGRAYAQAGHAVHRVRPQAVGAHHKNPRGGRPVVPESDVQGAKAQFAAQLFAMHHMA